MRVQTHLAVTKAILCTESDRCFNLTSGLDQQVASCNTMGNRSSKLNPEELCELQIKTAQSPHQLRKLYRDFLAQYPSGEMNRTEYLQLLQKLYPGRNCQELCDILFKVCDVNENDMIDFKEFMTQSVMMVKGSYDEKVRLAFDLNDINGDGTISPEELHRVIAAVYKANDVLDPEQHHQRADEIFAAMDLDENGTIDFSEFKDAIDKDLTLLKALTGSP